MQETVLTPECAELQEDFEAGCRELESRFPMLQSGQSSGVDPSPYVLSQGPRIFEKSIKEQEIEANEHFEQLRAQTEERKARSVERKSKTRQSIKAHREAESKEDEEETASEKAAEGDSARVHDTALTIQQTALNFD